MKRLYGVLRIGVSISLVAILALVLFSGLVVPHGGEFLAHLTSMLDRFSREMPDDRVYVQLDKSLYAPGETIWFQAYVCNAKTFQPSRQSDVVYVDLINPKGNVARQLTLLVNDGAARGDFLLDQDLAGGIYKVKAYTRWQKNFSDSLQFTKELQVQQVVLPHLKMKLEFEKKAFGPGDEVTAKFEATTLQNTPLANREFQGVARLNGKEYKALQGKTDRSGMAFVRVQLPKELSTTDGLLGVSIEHEGEMESISRSIPIVLNHISLSFYPEGGNCVNGITSRIAFQARNEFGKPADVEGLVLDDRGTVVTSFSSYHQGMGAFTLLPQSGRMHRVQLTRPKDIAKTYPLPAAATDGFTLGARIVSGDLIHFTVGTLGSQRMYLVGQVRGTMCFTRKLFAHRGENVVAIHTSEFPVGVLQTTLFDDRGVEQAERLVFINKQEQMRLTISSDKEKYLPRERVTMTIKATDRNGAPLAGNLSMSVVDDKLLAFADDKSGNILASLLLEQGLKGKIEEPNFYFDSKEQKSDQALDLLMMTRGWRGFTWKEVLTDELPQVTFRPERRAIAGDVMDYKTGQPIAGASVILRGTDRSTRTDDQGHFEIRDYEFTNPVPLNIFKDGYGVFATTLDDYTDTLVCELWRGITAPQPNNQSVSAYWIRAGRPSSISGRVVDMQTGEGLAAINVLVVGTAFGAVSDVDGRYTIMHVPPGTFSIRASQVGYETLNITDVKVDARMQTGLDFRLTPATVQIMGVVVSADAQMVNSNATVATQVVNAKTVAGIPNTKVVADVLRLQAGVVKQGGNLFLRGGRAGEAMYIVDGIPANNAGAHAAHPMALNGWAHEKVQRQRRYYRVRVFPAADYEHSQSPETRTDFRSTIFWKGDITLDKSGTTAVSFYNSDDITSFRATVEGIGAEGLIGRAEQTYFTQLPMSLAAKVPVEVSMGDTVLVPVTLKNNTDKMLTGTLTLRSPKSWKSSFDTRLVQNLGPHEARTLHIPFEVLNDHRKDTLGVAFESGGLRDAFQQEVVTSERGFPQEISIAGADKERSYVFHIDQAIPGTIQASVSLYPSVTSNLIAGLDAMLQEPNGCFEQTSSTNYPNVIVLRYLKEHGIDDAALTSRARDLLDHGYKKLTTFETKDKGYEWFGSTPPHEALTAYGLLEFKDMEPVYASVDKSMVDRTAMWLMSRRDGHGGFSQDAKALDSFGRANGDVTNCYIVYALSEAGYSGIETELDNAYRNAIASRDPYQLALVANALANAGDKQRAGQTLSELRSLQDADGSWTGKTGSITYSTGMSLKIETTSLAILALLKSNNPNPDGLSRGVKFILSSRSGRGGFGSTQGTILALKALTEYASYSRQTTEAGSVEVALDGNTIAHASYEAGEREPVTLDGLGRFLAADGKERTVTIRMQDVKHPLPHALNVRWHSTVPNSSESCKVAIRSTFTQAAVRTGETARLTTELTNATAGDIPMPIALVGIPGGLSPQPWQLKELQEKKVIDYYEIKGRYIAFYFRGLAANERRVINLDLKADIPGTYEAPASCAYLYYTSEHKAWTTAGTVEIAVNDR